MGSTRSTFEDVRFVGASLSVRVPELIEDFYDWLRGFSDFAHFFADPRMLERVKAQQRDYWTDFLAAEVDDAYVERRRVIGRTHARIELGLLIYLLAMEFVSAWLRRAIEADERLRQNATAAAFRPQADRLRLGDRRRHLWRAHGAKSRGRIASACIMSPA